MEPTIRPGFWSRPATDPMRAVCASLSVLILLGACASRSAPETSAGVTPPVADPVVASETPTPPPPAPSPAVVSAPIPVAPYEPPPAIDLTVAPHEPEPPLPVATPSVPVLAPPESPPSVVRAPVIETVPIISPPSNRIATMEPIIDVPQDQVQVLSFDDLNGWRDGDHQPVLVALREACEKISDAPADSGIGGHNIGGHPLFGIGLDWSFPCRETYGPLDATAYFEKHFVPVSLGGADTGTALFTAYYEPELNGSRVRGGPYQHPLYARPDDLENGVPYFDRAAIDAGALAGRGLEIFWVDDPIASFFLHIQGSGRIRLPDGSIARVGFAGKNNRSYKAIGKTLVEWGEMPLEAVSKRSIEDWITANPARRDALLGTNPSYVFFTEREELNADPGLGPIGSFGQPLPSNRAIAIDRRFYALGIPMWVDFDAPTGPIRRLTLALDTGGAIKGSRRADFFFGAGDAAGKAAGNTRTHGQLIAFTPRLAYERIFGPLL